MIHDVSFERASAALFAAAIALPVPAQQQPAVTAADPAQTAALTAFTQWLVDYRKGAVRFVKDGVTDEPALAGLDLTMGSLARTNTLAAAKLLFEAAAIDPRPPAAAATDPTTTIDLQRDLLPWRVQSLARKHLKTMTAGDIVPWLLRMLSAPGVRAAKANDDQRKAAAVLRVLAGHPSFEAQVELFRACRTLPAELRLLAVNALAKDATIDLVPTMLDLLRDAEPNIRIAAANALGTAMQPHVDESLGKRPEGDLQKQRDLVIEKLEQLLIQDPVWQVRSAAAFALAQQKCKPVIPALIRGLEAELARKKDPWAMDVRLHELLEGLTGQSVARGTIAPWREFWAREGPSFTVRPATAPGAVQPAPDKYEKFFDLRVDSDRVLFVLDFSGSMKEPVTLHARTTGAAPGTTTTKAALVVQELKKLVMSLPDGALVNFVVFGDEVRIWRQDGSRPALVKLDDDTRDDLLGHFLDTLQPNGSTNLYGALDAALEFGGRGLHDKYYAAGFDTLYVITDGAPSAGAVLDKDEIRRRVRETNQLRKIAIHCVTFGDQNDTDFLKTMAAENGGRHIHVD